MINASSVAFSGSTSGLTSPNMQAALNDAYNNCKTKCPDGYKCTLLPKYFAFGTPTTSSTTDYKTIGYGAFATLYSDGTTGGVCLNDGELFCLQTNDYDNSVAALKAHFEEYDCMDHGSAMSCSFIDFYCRAYSDGEVECGDYSTNSFCTAMADGTFSCR